MRVNSSDVLSSFVERGTTSWASQAVPLPARLTTGLWILGGVDAVVALWMYGVHARSLPCSTTLCSITTLGGRETALGLVAGGSLLGLLLLAVATGGFRRGGAPAVVCLCLLCVATVAATCGLALAALLVLTTLAAAALLVLAFVLALTAP
jgi:hypothetical protein